MTSLAALSACALSAANEMNVEGNYCLFFPSVAYHFSRVLRPRPMGTTRAGAKRKGAPPAPKRSTRSKSGGKDATRQVPAETPEDDEDLPLAVPATPATPADEQAATLAVCRDLLREIAEEQEEATAPQPSALEQLLREPETQEHFPEEPAGVTWTRKSMQAVRQEFRKVSAADSKAELIGEVRALKAERDYLAEVLETLVWPAMTVLADAHGGGAEELTSMRKSDFAKEVHRPDAATPTDKTRLVAAARAARPTRAASAATRPRQRRARGDSRSPPPRSRGVSPCTLVGLRSQNTACPRHGSS